MSSSTQRAVATASASTIDEADYFCGNRGVTAAVDSVIGGSATCATNPATGLRPTVGHGGTTTWTLNPTEVEVTIEHYVGDTYKSLGLTDPATYHATDVSVAGEPCVYQQVVGQLLCFPGGPTAIIVSSGSSQVSLQSQYESVARAVIRAGQ